jgi:MFS family permease
VSEQATPTPRLAVLLAMAMFVLVVDTSLMNVSISAVVEDLDTTVSGVQSAIALEALVSAAFILIGGKVGDLYSRKKAYVLGLLGYAVGALAMTLAQDLTAIIVCWAIIGGLGAPLLLPAHAVPHTRQLRARSRARRWTARAAPRDGPRGVKTGIGD